ncbi:SIS domain-containing protein [Proteiniphilum sp. X52]|uniref:SIS domain-containing protein n=1 Tax=Proteiniphilum sp. X52 TaxID=2382159 RepID=UPI000F0A397B|nr:SIS domain-containing protein [Proteiniphilum sp. X52]RNC63939.1 SIS domain-containing protein [Proteiniphilum sp. X52]
MNKFLSEIMEQPVAISNLVDFYSSEEGVRLLKQIKEALSLRKTEQVIFTGMGSSFFISFAAANLFNQFGIPSMYINTSELLHYNLSLFEKRTLLVCISQSGESYEIREILERLPDTVFCVGLVNEEESTLARKADVALLCKGGKEEMTSTKTYVVTSLAAYILGTYLAGEWNNGNLMALRQLQAHFKQSLLGYDHWLQKAIDFLGDINTLQIIARGPSYSTASQSALMFKEATHIAATGILGGEFRHGPMEMVRNGFKAILFASEGKTLEQSLKMAEDIVEFGGKIWLITNSRIDHHHPNILPVYIDETDEFLFSVHSIIPVQLFIDEYAKRHGFAAGSFSRGAKVTMIE